MELLLPNLGLIVWTSLAFIIVFILLSKFAWKPILKAIKEREDFIENSINNAKEAEKNMRQINANTERLLKEAQSEKQKIIADAQAMKSSIIADAQSKAKEEANKLINAAKADLNKSKDKMMQDIKKDLAKLIVTTTEKVLKEKLKASKEQVKIIDKAIAEISFN